MYVVEKQMNFTDYKDLEISKKNKKQRHSLVYINSERERERGRVKENLLIKKQTNGRKEKRPFIQNTYIEYPNYMLGYTSLALQNS